MTSSSNAARAPRRGDLLRPVFLLSPPRPDWAVRGRANGFAASKGTDTQAGNLGAGARADWRRVAIAIEEAGGVVVVVDNDGPAGDAALTGLPYTAEAGLCGVDPGDGAAAFILPRATPAHRQPEPVVVAPVIARLGLRTVTLAGDARFEGQGDVIRVGFGEGARFVCTAGAGRWARTAAPVFDIVERFVPGPALRVTFHADPWFHGNTFFGAWHVGGEVVVAVCEEALGGDDAARLRSFVDGARVIALSPEETLSYATNALQVGTTVLAPMPVHGRGVPDRIVDAWRALGLTVRFLELPTLFGRGGGAAVCLTNRLDGVTVDDVPDDLRLAAWQARQPDEPERAQARR